MTESVAPPVTVYFDDPNHLFTNQDRILLTKDITAAVHLDTDALRVHQGASIGLTVLADPSIPEAASAPSAWAPTATPNVLQSAAEVVINTGHQPTPDLKSDGNISLNPAFLHQMFLNPAPATDPNAPVPSNKLDAVSVFAHEFIHVLGFEGFLNQQATTAMPEPVKSNFDALVRFGATGPTFVGQHAEAYNVNEPVELTAGDLYHVGDATHFAADLMNGDHLYTGTHYTPSALDIGMLADLGYHAKPEDHVVAGFT
jgi:hypothetical protein